MTITDQKIYGHGWDPLSPDPQLGNPACVKAVSLMAEAKEQPAGRAGHMHFAIHFSAGVSLGNRTVLFLKEVRTALHQLLPQTEGDRAFY